MVSVVTQSLSRPCCYVCTHIHYSGPEVLFKTCVAMKFVDDDDDDDTQGGQGENIQILKAQHLPVNKSFPRYSSHPLG